MKSTLKVAGWCVVVLLALGLGAHMLGGQGRSESAVLKTNRQISCLAFSPDGKHLVAGTDHGSTFDPTFWEGELSVWETANRTKIHDIKLPRWVRDISFSRKGDLMAIGVGSHQDHTGGVPGGFEVKPGEAVVYSFPSMKEVCRIKSALLVNTVSLSPDGKWLATASRRETSVNVARLPAKVEVWEVATGKQRYALPEVVGYQCLARFTPDGKLLAVTDRLPPNDPRGSHLSEMRCFNAETGEPSHSFVLTGHGVLQNFVFFPTGRSVLVHGGDLKCWNIDTGEEAANPFAKSPPSLYRRIAAASSGNGLVVANDFIKGFPDKPAKVFVSDSDSDTIRDQWIWAGKIRGIRAVAISPDRRTVAVGNNDIYFFDVKAK